MKYLSILVPSYNVEGYLSNTLDSLLLPELLDDIEVIVVDDGSTDKTSQIADSYEAKYPESVVVVHKENGGYGSTINVAIGIEDRKEDSFASSWKGATGRFLCVVDGDDRVSSEIKQVVDAAKQNTEVDMVVFDGEIVNLDGIVIAQEQLSGLHPGTNELNALPQETQLAIGIHNTAISLDVLRKNHVVCHHNHFYVDHEFVLYSLRFCRSVFYVNAPIYRYTIGREGQSVSLEGRKRHFKDYLEVYEWLTAYYEKFKDTMSAPMKKLYLNEICNHVIGVYGFYLLCYTENHKQELMSFDEKLKQDSSEIYSALAGSLSIKMLRISNFSLYKLAGWFYVHAYAKKRYQL